MKALVMTPKHKHVFVTDITIPEPGPREVLICVGAVALNRVDWLYTANPVAAQDYRVVGSGFAGTITRVGKDIENLPDQRVKTGTRVAGFVQGGLDRISVQTGQPINVLIYGATSSLGLFAAQSISLSKQFSETPIRLIGVASVSKHGLLREAPYSYDTLFDYRDSDWPKQVKKACGANHGVHFAIDAVSISATVEQVESTLAPNGPFAVYRSPALRNFDKTKLTIKSLIGAVWEGLAREFTAKFFTFLSTSASHGKPVLAGNPTRQISGGLESIAKEGLQLVGPNKPAGVQDMCSKPKDSIAQKQSFSAPHESE
ncbi:hypothetical protein G7054_g2485 [Neopestalotiopsis clavispora]|nr:hypothetical protein G7054_g2485 [Neopestalotiopsis clavispora]